MALRLPDLLCFRLQRPGQQQCNDASPDSSHAFARHFPLVLHRLEGNPETRQEGSNGHDGQQ